MSLWGTQWQATWNPHVYMPPQYPRSATYWDPPPWGIPYVHGADTSNIGATGYRSTKYPDLNPILAIDTTLLRFNVAKKPRNDINTALYNVYCASPATATPVNHIRIISKSFPWSIDIKATPIISCNSVWEAIYSALQEDLADSEWGMIVNDRDLMATVESSARRRDPENGYKKMKRIDFLGRLTIFRGLEKDGDFAAQRLLPGADPCPDTWVLRLGD